MIFQSEISLELIEARILAIPMDDLRRSFINTWNSISHTPVLDINRVSLVDWEISIVFLFLDDIDGIVEVARKMIFYFGASSLYVLIVMSLVLEQLVQLWVLCSHWVNYFITQLYKLNISSKDSFSLSSELSIKYSTIFLVKEVRLVWNDLEDWVPVDFNILYSFIVN